MRFTELDARMRVYETAHDHSVLPHVYIVARLDGRGFTKMAKDAGLDRPFDRDFHQLMSYLTKKLIEDSGFTIIYGYTQSDEISLLFALDEDSFNRKLRKINTTLASFAGAWATKLFEAEWLLRKQYKEGARPDANHRILTFDCRVSQLPSMEEVVTYFSWRQADATRNALSTMCYWFLRQSGLTKRQATKRLERASVSDKNELLFSEFNTNFNDTPLWQRRGVGYVWGTETKTYTNLQTGRPHEKTKRVLELRKELPKGESYRAFVRDLLQRDWDRVHAT